MGEHLSPVVLRKLTDLATRLGSFAAASDSLEETLEIDLNPKRVERQTERIGAERVAERALAIAAWDQLPLMEKLAAPPGVKVPDVVCIECDGGRIQRCDLPADAKSHWTETKMGLLLELEPRPLLEDPCPELPSMFYDVVRMAQITKEIKSAVPKGKKFESVDEPSLTVENTPPSATEVVHAGASEGSLENAVAVTPAALAPSSASPPLTPHDTAECVSIARAEVVAEPPKVLARDVVASLANAHAFGKHLAATAWSLGFAKAVLKSFVADGSSTNWGIWERHFKHLEFIPILDIIHALTYVYSAAMAGREAAAGAVIYLRWMTWVWRGEVTRVIAELAQRQLELGPPPAIATETDPRKVVAETLTYLTNQQSRMNDPTYRLAGLPITSSWMESTVKQINRRVKGSEKFWTKAGGEDLAQLSADKLCDTAPLTAFWTRRAHQATGLNRYTNPRTPKSKATA